MIRGLWPLEGTSTQWVAQGLQQLSSKVPSVEKRSFQHRAGLDTLPAGAPPCQVGRAAPRVPFACTQSKAHLALCPSVPVGTAGPAQQAWKLSPNRPLPEWPQPLPSAPLHLSSPCPGVSCVCLYVLNTQGFPESWATSKWSGDWEGGPGHYLVRSASEPLCLRDEQSCLLGAGPDKRLEVPKPRQGDVCNGELWNDCKWDLNSGTLVDWCVGE